MDMILPFSWNARSIAAAYSHKKHPLNGLLTNLDERISADVNPY